MEPFKNMWDVQFFYGFTSSNKSLLVALKCLG
jgi:hypothetical protein